MSHMEAIRSQVFILCLFMLIIKAFWVFSTIQSSDMTWSWCVATTEFLPPVANIYYKS